MRARQVLDHLRANAGIWVLFAAAWLWIGWFAFGIHSFFVMPDELRYVKQAVSWGTGRPVVPGSEAWVTASQLQPILLAPLWGTLSSFHAYRLSHIETALLFASAVFPAYLLARDVLRSHGWALVAAALSIVIPWSVMTGVMMLENTAYPMSLWGVLAVHRAATRPSRRADLIALGALALAYVARSQLLVLWAALPVVLVAQGLRFPVASVATPTRRVRAIVERHWIVFAVGALVLVAGAIDRRALVGNSPPGAKFGIESFAFGREMLAYVAVGIGMIPLALAIAWVLATLARPLTPERHAYAVILLTVTVLLAVVVGGGSRVFAPDQLRGVNDRYLFYAAPLLFIAMLAFLLERRRMTLLTLVGGFLAAWIAWASHLLLAGTTFVTPTATYHPKLNHYAEKVGGWLGADAFTSGKLAALVTVVACVLIAVARRFVRTELVAGVVALVVGGYVLNETQYTRHRLNDIQPASDYGKRRDWVDRTLPRGARAAILLSSLGVDGPTAQATWWDAAFWNKKATAFRFALTARTVWDGQGVPHRLSIDEAAGRTSGLDGFHYLLRGVADRRFGFVGETTIGAPHNNLQLWQIQNADRLAWWFRGPEDTGYLPAGSSGRLRVFAGDQSGERVVRLPLGTSFGATAPARFEIRMEGRVLADGEVAVGKVATPEVRVALPAGGHAELELTAGSAEKTGLQFYGAAVAPVGA